VLRRRSTLALLAVLLQSTTGCSFAFMSKAQEPIAVPTYPVDCTSSVAAPVLDSICSGYFVVNAIALAGMKTCDSAGFGEACISSSTKSGGILLSAGLAVLCGVSAGSGFGYASKCEGIKNLNAMCITGNEASCKKLNPAWVAPLKLPPPPPPADPTSAAPATAPTTAPAAAPAGTNGGCSRDTDCKGDRICVQGSCVEPAAKAPPAQ
jgi:hypothetical protein